MPIRPENRARYPDDWPDIVAQVRERSGSGRIVAAAGTEQGRGMKRCKHRTHKQYTDYYGNS